MNHRTGFGRTRGADQKNGREITELGAPFDARSREFSLRITNQTVYFRVCWSGGLG